jgi:indole-3-glycerol phosphate synthase
MLQLIERKKWEVRQLEEKHSDTFDPLQMRLGYVAEQSSLKLTRALRLFSLGDENRRVSVVGDLKRLSPTAPNMPRTVGSFLDAGKRANELFDSGVNVVMVNTDATGWSGSMDDLDSVAAAVKQRSLKRRAEETNVNNEKGKGPTASAVYSSGPSFTAVLCKDLFIHPLQVKIFFL